MVYALQDIMVYALDPPGISNLKFTVWQGQFPDIRLNFGVRIGYIANPIWLFHLNPYSRCIRSIDHMGTSYVIAVLQLSPVF